MQIDIVVLFFLLGFLATFLKSHIEFPEGLYKGLVLFLLLAIGLKGGSALEQYFSTALFMQVAVILLLGITLPLIAYPVLKYFGQLERVDAANIAAHYGSVSVATYAVAVAFLESKNIAYEAYFPLFVAVLEAPAIVVGILLAKQRSESLNMKGLLHESFLNQGVLLLLGGVIIGWLAPPSQTASIAPLFKELFHGALALFLLAMGQIAARQSKHLLEYGTFIATFGVLMPLVGGLIGGLLAWLMGLSEGGTLLLATLGASCSYIAVPAAMSVAVPKANQGIAITASLGVTFPFNVLVGIPLYYSLTHKILFT